MIGYSMNLLQFAPAELHLTMLLDYIDVIQSKSKFFTIQGDREVMDENQALIAFASNAAEA